MKSLLLCGGKGKRLRPITYEIPKCILPFQRRTILDQTLDLFWNYGVFETWLGLGYLANKIMEKFPLPYIFERHPLGTGAWIKLLPREQFKEDFFVCNGDNLYNINLKKMMEFHKKSGALVTIAAVRVKDVRPFGSLHIKNDKILAFEEKKKARIKRSGWVNSGLYIFSPKIFDVEIKDTIEEGKISLEHDIFPKLAKEGKVFAFKGLKEWYSINDFKEYEKAMKHWVGDYE